MTLNISPRLPLPLHPPAGARGSSSAPAAASIRLVAQHFGAATIYLLAGSVGLVWIAPELAAGMYLSPHVAGITHLFTLGWLTTTVFGALYQLLPGALGAPIRWPRVGHVSFWTFAPGAGLFAGGVAGGSVGLHHAGISLIALGIALAMVNIVSSLHRANARDVTWAAIATASTFLVSTFGLGVLLLHNVHTGFLAAARLRVLATHLHVAIIGWALIMMVGVSHRMLPMFLVAHGANRRWTKRAIPLLAAGIPVLAVGLNTPSYVVSWLGVLLLELGVACFLWQALSYYRARLRKQIDVGMRFAGSALAFLMLAAGLGPALLANGPAASRLATIYVLLGLLGGIVLFVIGFFYKIVPLLAWTARFGDRVGSARVPTVAEMYSARVALVQLGVMPSGVGALALAIAVGSPWGAYAGATLFLTGVLLFVSQIVRVAFGGSGDRERRA
jgi:hypothetical protein